MTIQEWKPRLINKTKNIIAIASYYGKAPQLRMLAEECSELAKEALKAIRSKGDNRNALIEEMADVEIMMEQNRYLWSISYEEIFKVKEEKLARQLERIRIEKENQTKIKA